MDQPTVLVTGATDGLGRRVAEELARRGATVLVHGRNPARVDATVTALADLPGSGPVTGYVADYSSLGAVRDLTAKVRADHSDLALLVNNAGIGFGHEGEERQLSDDGYELRFQVNYLSHFLLTNLLVDHMVAAAPARIVNVASAGQQPLDLGNLMLTSGYNGVRAYRQAKLALVMFTFDLAEKLAGTGVDVNCLHPGTFMPTKMVTAAGIHPIDTLERGVEATLRLAADPDLTGISGRYFDRFDRADPHPQAADDDVRRRLWQLSCDLVGLAPA